MLYLTLLDRLFRATATPFMATGDLTNNLRRLQRALRSVGYGGALDLAA